MLQLKVKKNSSEAHSKSILKIPTDNVRTLRFAFSLFEFPRARPLRLWCGITKQNPIATSLNRTNLLRPIFQTYTALLNLAHVIQYKNETRPAVLVINEHLSSLRNYVKNYKAP